MFAWLWVMGLDFAKCGVFFRAKPVSALVALGNSKREWYASLLAKEVDCTFPHLIKVLAEFETLGLVSFREEGRKKIITLTDKGRQCAAGFTALVSSME